MMIKQLALLESSQGRSESNNSKATQPSHPVCLSHPKPHDTRFI